MVVEVGVRVGRCVRLGWWSKVVVMASSMVGVIKNGKYYALSVN